MGDPIDLSKVEIWQWNDDPGISKLQRRGEDIAIELDKIKDERAEKACQLEWTRQVTWIHVPTNDMRVCKKVLEIVCGTGQNSHLQKDEYWSEQLHEPSDWSDQTDEDEPYDSEDWGKELVRAPFMDAKGWALKFEVKNGNWEPREPIELRHENARSKRGIENNSILYMPYLHWDYLKKHNDETKSRHEQSMRSSKQPTEHLRRSLDEAALRHYSYDNLMEKNRSQVVTRFLEKEKEKQHRTRDQDDKPTLMVVDQLWLWILDKDTIVSSFPDSPGDHPEDEKYDLMKCKYLHLKCLVQGRFNKRHKDHGTALLARCIINRSYSIFLHAHLRGSRLGYLDIFRKSIEDQRANCANLFLALQGPNTNILSTHNNGQRVSGTGKKKRPKDVLNIQDDIAAVANVLDIEEELQIILHVVQQQIGALDSPVHHRRDFFVKELNGVKEELTALCEQARLIHEKLFQVLELKQTLLSVRQNQIVLTFTIVTIIFVPLGFISSIFGMNATELSDGSPVGLRRIFIYMFPISFVISLLALLLAFGSDVASIFDSTRQSIHPSPRLSQKFWSKRDTKENGHRKRISEEGSNMA